MSLRDYIPQGHLPELHNLNPHAPKPRIVRTKRGFWAGAQFIGRGTELQVLAETQWGVLAVNDAGDQFNVAWEFLCKTTCKTTRVNS